MEILKNLYSKYKHVIPMLIYMVIYLAWFAWLESTVTKDYQVIYMKIDDYIPFLEVFVIPYFLWFIYVAVVGIYLALKDTHDFNRFSVFLIVGMTIFLIVSTLWPNGHHLRLTEMPRDNIFTRMIAFLWETDTATNLWPSIHVYNSMAAHFAVIRCKALENKKGFKIASGILAVSIILSTVLIKQHSVFDLLTGVALGALMYVLVYRRDVVLAARTQHDQNKRTPQVE